MSRLHAARSGRRHRCREEHWSNIQLPQVELSTPDAATKVVTSCERKSALPQTGFGASGMWKRRDEEKGEEKSRKEDIWWTSGEQATQDLQYRTASGRTEDAQARVRISRGVRKTKTKQTRAAQ